MKSKVFKLEVLESGEVIIDNKVLLKDKFELERFIAEAIEKLRHKYGDN